MPVAFAVVSVALLVPGLMEAVCCDAGDGVPLYTDLIMSAACSATPYVGAINCEGGGQLNASWFREGATHVSSKFDREDRAISDADVGSAVHLQVRVDDTT